MPLGAIFLSNETEYASVRLVPKEPILTKPTRMALPTKTVGLNDRHAAVFNHSHPEGAIDSEPCQRYITTAIPAKAAFRLRDDVALINALWLMV